MPMLREARAASLLLISVCALTFLNASTPLNPRVRVLRKTAATSTVSTECDEGLAPQSMPRIDVAEVPAPVSRAAMQAPPSATLRATLREAQDAAASSDRAAFQDAMSRAKEMLQTYPAGGEKNAANDVMRVYADLDRLWTYEFETPSGAFFDASTGLLQMLNAYPGYQAAVAEETVTVGGEKLYPSRESRDFLVRQAASRLKRLGGTSATPMTASASRPRRPRVDDDTDQNKPLPPIVPKSRHRAPSQHATRTTPHTTPHTTPRATTVTKIVPPVPAPRTPQPTKTTTTQPKATTTQPAKTTTQPKATPLPVPPPVVATHTNPAPPPATATTRSSTPMATTSSAPVATTTNTATTATETATTTSATTDTTGTSTTTASASTESTSSAPATTPTSNSSKSVILPIILIVIGVGVLIVLFRASS